MKTGQLHAAIVGEFHSLIEDGYRLLFPPVEVASGTYIAKFQHQRNGNRLTILVNGMQATFTKNGKLVKTISVK